jgi:hypothetical protein
VIISIRHVFNESSRTNLVGNALVEDEERIGRVGHVKGCRVVIAAKLRA